MKNNIGQSTITSKILKDNDFFIKKKFGQNFLIDQNVLSNIVSSAEIDNETDVIEVGPGLGSLTEHLANKARRVLCYEIDSDLIPILDENLKGFNNIRVVNQDILKVDINQDINKYFPDSKKIYLVANLPYYITTPIILNLLEATTLIKRYVMMMQLEVADRICSKPDVKDYNALSVAIQYRAEAKKVMHVSSNVFIPKPGVDSAVIRLDLFDKPKYNVKDEAYFFKLVRQSFSQRRKTLANNLAEGNITKQMVYDALEKIGLNKEVRAEVLSIEDFVKLTDELTK